MSPAGKEPASCWAGQSLGGLGCVEFLELREAVRTDDRGGSSRGRGSRVLIRSADSERRRRGLAIYRDGTQRAAAASPRGESSGPRRRFDVMHAGGTLSTLARDAPIGGQSLTAN